MSEMKKGLVAENVDDLRGLLEGEKKFKLVIVERNKESDFGALSGPIIFREDEDGEYMSVFPKLSPSPFRFHIGEGLLFEEQTDGSLHFTHTDYKWRLIRLDVSRKVSEHDKGVSELLLHRRFHLEVIHQPVGTVDKYDVSGEVWIAGQLISTHISIPTTAHQMPFALYLRGSGELGDLFFEENEYGGITFYYASKRHVYELVRVNTY